LPADWQSFPRSSAALRSEISRRKEALATGPIGNRGVELASLRLAATGADLATSGSVEGAREALERAVSLDAANGYALLWLAWVEHVRRDDQKAAQLAAEASRHLPSDPAIRAELEGLISAIHPARGT
jgi:hypothetical protein